MYLFRKNSALRQLLGSYRSRNRKLGFVPTMGALHEGHLALIRRSMEHAAYTACSIFVNPTQFNDPSDLKKYPQAPAKDLEMLYGVGCDVVYMPTVEDVYPAGVNGRPPIDLNGLDEKMEGRFRSGHFQGVAQVVRRLLEIVEPGLLVMGQKDYQQFLIVEHMIRELKLPVELIMGETVREKDGLAMSSRNARLDQEARKKAPLIYQTLQDAIRWMEAGEKPAAACEKAMEQLRNGGLEPEYFEVVDGDNLEPLQDLRPAGKVAVLTAAWAGGVRLIDNILAKGAGQ